jgi:hypothetical protein
VLIQRKKVAYLRFIFMVLIQRKKVAYRRFIFMVLIQRKKVAYLRFIFMAHPDKLSQKFILGLMSSVL